MAAVLAKQTLDSCGEACRTYEVLIWRITL